MQSENPEAAYEEQDTGSKEPKLGSGEEGTSDAESETADEEKKANANACSGDWKRLFEIDWQLTERRRSDDLVVAASIVSYLRSTHSI